MLKKIVSNAVIYALGPQLPKLVGIIMMPLITANMTSLDYGLSGIIFAYVAGLEAFSDLGLRMQFTNAFFKYPKRFKYIWKRLFGFVQLWSFFYSAIVAVTLYVVLPSEAERNFIEVCLLIVIPLILLKPVTNVGIMFYQYSKLPLPVSLISVVSGCITVLANYFFIVQLKLGYMGLFYAQFVANLVAFLPYAYLIFVKQRIIPSFRFSLSWIRKKLIIALPTIPHYYAGYIMNVSDRVILSFMNVPLEKIGLYSFSYSFGSYFSILGKAWSKAAAPYYMENNQQDETFGDSRNAVITNTSQIIFLLLAFNFVLFLPEIFQILVRNEELRNGYLIAAIVVYANTYFPFYNVIALKLWHKEFTKKLTGITMTAAVTSLVINVMLVPYFNIWGSAISTIVSLLVLGYSGHYKKSINALFKEQNNPLKYLLTLFLLMLISLLCINQGKIFKGLIMLSTNIIFISVYRILFKDIRKLKNLSQEV